MNKIKNHIMVGIIISIFLMPNAVKGFTGPEYTAYWNVADSGGGRYFDARMVDRLAYVNNGQTVDNLIGITNAISETTGSLGTYKPHRVIYTIYTRAYTVSGNPVASVSVHKGPDYSSTITDIQEGYEYNAGLSYYVSAGASRSNSFTSVSYSYTAIYQTTIGGPINYYDSYGSWYPNAKVTFQVNTNNPSTTSFESADVVRLGVDSTDIAAMGGSSYFDILIHIEYEWVHWDCIPKLAWSSGCNGYSNGGNLLWDFYLQLGRPGIQDGNSGNDGEISRFLVDGVQTS